MNTTILILNSLILVLSIIAVILSFKIISLRQRIKILIIALSRVEDIINEANKQTEDNDVHKENFIKFLSDSRDWAYEYIKNVQDGLSNFVNEIEPEIAYFNEYGMVGDAYPHYHSMKKISQEYEKLKKMLPEESE